MLRLFGALILAFLFIRAAPIAFPILFYAASGGALISYGRPINSLDIHRHFEYTVALLPRLIV